MIFKIRLHQPRVSVPGILLVAATLTLVSACAGQTPVLNSERIAQRFGSYGVDVLTQRGDLRVTSLFSGSGSNKTTRTLAIVRFQGAAVGALANAHREILAGSSLGATLKAHGFAVAKFTLDIDTFEPTALSGRYSELMRLSAPTSLAMHAYRLRAQRTDESSVPYATIIELHHPDYLTHAELESIFGGQPAEAPMQGEIAQLLIAGGERANLW
ncbi:MAG: hypothetical protein AAF417_09060 [Pseudomonadota bacterium]